MSRDLVVKSNTLVESIFDLSVMESRMLLLAISKINRNENSLTVSFRVQELLQKLGTTTMRYTEIKKVVESLLTKYVVIRDKTSDDKKRVSKMSWCKRIEYIEDGTIRFVFDEFLAPYLLELNSNFTMYYIETVMKFRGKYTHRFYEFMKKNEYKKRVIYSVSDLREMLKCETIHVLFKEFERKVIKPSIEEINQHSDLFVEYKKQKKGRTITEIEFVIQPKNDQKNCKTQSGFELLTEEEFEKLRKEFTLDEIIEVYDRVRFGASSLKIKNHYAYILTVLREEKKQETKNENGRKKDETKTEKEKKSSRNFEKVFDDFCNGFEM